MNYYNTPMQRRQLGDRVAQIMGALTENEQDEEKDDKYFNAQYYEAERLEIE